MALRAYSSKDHSIIVGPAPMVRLGEPGFELKMNGKDTIQIGSSGEGTIIKSPDRSGTLMLHLSRDSESNAILSGYRTLQKNNPNGFAVPFMVKDLNGATTVFAAQAIVSNDPDLSNPKGDAPDVVWELISDDIEVGYAGTVAPSSPV